MPEPSTVTNLEDLLEAVASEFGGKHWEFYRPRLESLLLSLQQEDGSWPKPPSGGSELNAGPPYFTATAVLALSVKYHYLPIYQR